MKHAVFKLIGSNLKNHFQYPYEAIGLYLSVRIPEICARIDSLIDTWGLQSITEVPLILNSNIVRWFCHRLACYPLKTNVVFYYIFTVSRSSRETFVGMQSHCERRLTVQGSLTIPTLK